MHPHGYTAFPDQTWDLQAPSLHKSCKQNENQFGVFQAGADNGIKVGDKFTIFRGGAAIGKIVVQRVTPVLSVFKADPAFGQPQSPYKIGDSVMKTN